MQRIPQTGSEILLDTHTHKLLHKNIVITIHLLFSPLLKNRKTTQIQKTRINYLRKKIAKQTEGYKTIYFIEITFQLLKALAGAETLRLPYHCMGLS